MNELQEQEEQVKQHLNDWGQLLYLEHHEAELAESLNALLRKFVEECCEKIPEYWQEVLRRHFAWLLEGD